MKKFNFLIQTQNFENEKRINFFIQTHNLENERISIEAFKIFLDF